MAACQTSEHPPCPEKALSTRFMSELKLKGENAVIIEEGAKDVLLQGVFQNAINLALSGKIQPLAPFNSVWEADLIVLTPQEMKMKLFTVDTQYIENPNPPYDLVMQVVNDSFELSQAYSIRPYEIWQLDTLRITKKVDGYAIVRESVDKVTGEVRGTEPLFMVRNSAKTGTSKKVATIRYTQPIADADPLQPWMWYRQNLEASVRERVFGNLLAKATQGNLTAYASPTDKTPLSKEALTASLQHKDTVYIESPEPPYDLSQVVMDVPTEDMDILAIEFVQDVLIDEHGNLTIDVKWYGPVTGNTDKNGQLTNPKTLFWVKN